MKKKIILLECGIVICLGILFCFHLKNKNNFQKNNVTNKNNSIAIMIKESGETDYTKYSSNSIPIGNYILNEEKTYCENNGKVSSYDNANGAVSFLIDGTDKCYLYFDYFNNDLSSIIEEKTNTTNYSSQDNSIYEITDFDGYFYRFAGKDPDNYICLDNLKSGDCAANDLYRIIYYDYGVIIQDSIRVIKNDFYGSYAFDTNMSNIWYNSSLKKIFENNFYLSLPTKVQEYITESFVTSYEYNQTLIDTYVANKLVENELGNYANEETLIALMTPGDFVNGVRDEDCSHDFSFARYRSNSSCYENNWLYLNELEWTVAPSNDSKFAVFIYKGSPYLNAYGVSNPAKVRPVFSMYVSNIISGNGSKTSPWRFEF